MNALLTRVVMNTGCALLKECIILGMTQDFAKKQVWEYVFDTTSSTLAADLVVQTAMNRRFGN